MLLGSSQENVLKNGGGFGKGDAQVGWLGKIVGGTIGFALGGPLGAIAGATFGHAFDSSPGEFNGPGHQRLSTGENTQFTFFVATFSMLAKLAKADGRVSDEEVRSIESFMVNDLRLTSQSRAVAFNIFNTALNSPGTFDQFAAQFYSQFSLQPQMLEMMIDILLRVSIADGTMSQSEERLILTAVNTFNFSRTRYDQLKSRYVKVTGKYYQVLGCSPDDPDEKIKSSYRKLVQEYHPDKIAAKGLPEEFTKFAQDKFREIQEAWDAVKQERGIR